MNLGKPARIEIDREVQIDKLGEKVMGDEYECKCCGKMRKLKYSR